MSSELSVLYEKLLLARLCEEKIRKEYSKDEMKTPMHLGIGSEAIVVGVTSALPKGSRTFGTYRNHVLYLSMTDDVEGFFCELYGKATGPGKGKAGSMHLALPERGLIATSAVVASTIPLAVGAAFAAKYKGTQEIVVSFFGDGAVEEGVFSESLNFACLHKLPMLFVCEDNDLAIHTVAKHRQGFNSIVELVRAYDCHSASSKGNDVQLVLHHTRQILNEMSLDPRPGFLHFDYFRFLEHVGPSEDFSAGYRPRPSDEQLREWDPVACCLRRLHAEGMSSADTNAIEHRLSERIERATEAARKAPFPDPAELYTDLLI